MSRARNNVFPTASTVAVLLNGYHVEYAYRIDWKESQPKIPLYNYNSTKYGRVMAGRQLVQGYLVVNFVHPGYLTEVLKLTKGGPVFRLAGTGVTSVDMKDPVSQRIQKELNSLTGVTEDERRRRIDTIAGLLNDGKTREQVIEVLRKKSAGAETGRADIRRVLSPIHAGPNNENTMELYYHDVNHVRWYSVFYNVEFSDITQQISIAGEGSSESLFEMAEFICSHRETHEIRVRNE